MFILLSSYTQSYCYFSIFTLSSRILYIVYYWLVVRSDDRSFTYYQLHIIRFCSHNKGDSCLHSTCLSTSWVQLMHVFKPVMFLSNIISISNNVLCKTQQHFEVTNSKYILYISLRYLLFWLFILIIMSSSTQFDDGINVYYMLSNWKIVTNSLNIITGVSTSP